MLLTALELSLKNWGYHFPFPSLLYLPPLPSVTLGSRSLPSIHSPLELGPLNRARVDVAVDSSYPEHFACIQLAMYLENSRSVIAI